MIDDAEVIIVSFGMASRVARASIEKSREEGMKVGLVRPITLWPFPVQVLSELAQKKRVKGFLDVEMNFGQMIEDVRLAVNGRKNVSFYGRTGGMLPDEDELFQKIVEVYG
jgi:2-oxoglutarate ferredoxin oxidoreductase subunit alpha